MITVKIINYNINMHVIKSDGSKMPFDSKKIIRAITRAAQDAGLSSDEINHLVNDVSNKTIEFVEAKDKIPSSEIRYKILAELDNIEPKVANEWRKFMEAKSSR